MKTQTIVPSTPTYTDSPLISVSTTLGGIILLILVMAWLAKRLGFLRTRSVGKKTLQISASANLGPRERIVVVDIEGARLVLGITASQITHLHTLPPVPESEQSLPHNNPTDFQKIMKNILKSSGKMR